MNTTRIEWCRNIDGSPGYTVNPVKGLCPVDCKDTEGKSYCFARRMYRRFKWDERVRFDHHAFDGIAKLKKPSRIFVGSTMELFGTWVPSWAVPVILDEYVSGWTQHTFIFLTKRPWELKKYNPWPANCWVGMSATNMSQIGDLPEMGDVQAKVKFVSFEPLLDYSAPDLRWVDWVIIGQQTPVRKPIPAWWITNIEQAANQQHIPVFHKNNLGIRPQALRQEWPNGS